METYAYFDDIYKHILQELNQTMFDVTAAIAWFTDEDIYDLLCKKAAQNISVRVLLIKDHINTGQYGLNFDRLKDLGGQVFFIPDPKHSGVTMHHKFCVIDDNTVLTGSYNWSKRARQNYENITVIKDNIEFARKYREEFENILAINGLVKKAGIRLDFTQIATRLDLIKNLISLGETNDIDRHIEKLQLLEDDQELQNIVLLLQRLDFNKAITGIEQYKKIRQQIIEYHDPNIVSLELELRTLEIEISTLNYEKIEIERQILFFHHQQNLTIGGLLVDYYRLRREKLRREWVRSGNNSVKNDESKKDQEKRKSEYEEANKEYEECKDDYEATKQEETVPKLSKENQEKLKELYRRASWLCHPDKVAESDKKRAHEAFVELQEAYRKNDLETVQKIFEYLKEGKIFTDRSKTISEKDSIKIEIINLRRKIEIMLDQINQLVSSSSWQTISKIEDWDDYFDDQKQKLEAEIEFMKLELENE